MTNANQLTLAAARDALRKGELSAVDLTMACLTAMDAGDALGAYVHKTPELALDQARAADARLQAGMRPISAVSRWGSRICSAPRACRHRPRQTSLKASSPNTNPP